MAIYHFSAKVISRANGSSALAAAAYRSASRLHDERLDRHHDFSNKAGVVHSEVMLPEGAPEHLSDREKLWNEVEAAEKRIDAQLAREIEFAIPREMTKEQGIELARDFVREEFVDRGMIADLNVHWDVGADGLAKPHAHVMLTMREIGEDGFGPKNRDWNRTDLLEKWRERWSEHVNQRLAELDIDARVDHRSLEAQGIELEPQHKIGPAASRMAAQDLASERLEEHHAIARANGEKIIADPNIALDAITRQQATFTRRDLAMFVHRHSDGKEQFDRVMGAVRFAPDLVALGKDGRGEQRFASRDIIETERRLERVADRLADRAGHGLPAATKGGILITAGSGELRLGEEQQAALKHITRPTDLAIVTGYAGTGKSAMLGIARDEWERAGYRVVGAALSGIAAENLEGGSGIASHTIASLEHQWSSGRELLGDRTILVVDEAGMIGTRQLERVISEADKRGAKVVLVGDPEQLQAIEAGAAFRALAERHGSVEITQVRRQRDDWQRDATRRLATGRTAQAIAAYDEHGRVHGVETRDQARGELIERWDRDRAASPGATCIILTHTNDEVGALNIAARERLRSRRALGDDVAIRVERGERNFACGDRVMFLRNERSLGVKNGTLGEVRSATATRLAVLLDDGRSVAFDIKDYAAIDHGYAATVHKAQGMTVDRVHVLATPGLDRHAAYVALSRHRESVDLHYGRDDFADRGKLVATLSRERGKDMASDYLDLGTSTPVAASRSPTHSAPIEPREQQRSTLTRPDHERSDVPALSDAVARHGRIVSAMRFAHRVGDPYSAEQRSELATSRAALESIVQHGANDLEAAFSGDQRLIGEAAAGRTQSVIRAMQLEAEMRSDPNLRADVFVQRWQALDRQRQLLMREQETGKAAKIAESMIGMARSLERDPQLESILRNRRQALGLPSAVKQGVGRELADMMARTRSRGLDIGM